MLMRAGTAGCPEIPEWLADTLHEGARVGIDPFLHTVFAPSGLLHRVENLAAHMQRRAACYRQQLACSLSIVYVLPFAAVQLNACQATQ